MFAMHMSKEGFIPRIHKEVLKISKKKADNPNKK